GGGMEVSGGVVVLEQPASATEAARARPARADDRGVDMWSPFSGWRWSTKKAGETIPAFVVCLAVMRLLLPRSGQFAQAAFNPAAEMSVAFTRVAAQILIDARQHQADIAHAVEPFGLGRGHRGLGAAGPQAKKQRIFIMGHFNPRFMVMQL